MNQDILLSLSFFLLVVGFIGSLIRKYYLNIVLSLHIAMLGVILLIHTIARDNALNTIIIIVITFCVLTIQATSVALFVFRQHGTTEIDTLRESGG